MSFSFRESRPAQTGRFLCAYIWNILDCFEFNKNSTPLWKVQLIYETMQNAFFKKASNTNTLRHIIKRWKTHEFELITRRSEVQVLPPQPYRVFITNLRVGCGHSISFCLHFVSSCMYEQGLSCSFCYAGNAFGTYSTATPFRVSSR